MSKKDFIYQKLKKFDLHLHTLASKKDDKSKFVNIDQDNVVDFVNKLDENKIKMIGITNHNLFDYDQYKLIQEKSKNIFEVIPGVEITIHHKDGNEEKKFQCNLLFDNFKDENVLFNAQLINKELNKLNVKDENNHLKQLEWNDFLNFSNKLKGRVIMMVDYEKSSSNLNNKNNWIKQDFWFYFDMYEGNKKRASIDLDEKFKKAIDKGNKTTKPYVLGTDNRNYNLYPKTTNKKGDKWTGTYFFVENTFNGLLSAIDFPIFVFNIEDETKVDNYLKNTLLIKNIDYMYEKNSEIQKIYLDRGLNVILGRRGSGKTKLFNDISNELKKYEDKSVFVLEQNKIQEIFSGGILNSKFSDEKTKEKPFKTVLKNNINEKIESKIIDNFKLNNMSVKDLSNHFYNMIDATIKKNTLDTVDKVQNKFNEFFEKFNNENKIINDLTSLNTFFSSNKNNEILKLILKNINNPDSLKSDINLINIQQIKKIKFDYKKDVNIKIDQAISFKNLEKFMKSFDENINKNNEKFEELIESIKSIIANIQKEEVCVNDNMKNFELHYIFNFKSMKDTEEIINKIGKKNNKKDLYSFIEIQIKKFKIWDSNNIELETSNKTKDFENHKNFNISYNLNGKDISNYSPGQVVEEYIMTAFDAEKYNAIIIDQPEDQLDALTVSNSIINPILKMYREMLEKGIQIIFVTHDPKIAINLSPVNIIECVNENQTFIKNFYKISDIYKENNSIIEKVDGKIEYVHKRSNIYGNKI